MRACLLGAAAAAMIHTASAAQPAQPLQVTVVPAQPLLERTLYGQALNFDFRIANRSSQPLELRVVKLAVRDPGGAIVAQLELNDNGIQPGITIVANRKVAAGAQLTLFNPFHTLAAQWPLGSLDYTFRFSDDKDGEVVQSVHVVPKAYATRTRLRLPLDGRLLVWDGHDFYSHHRRFDYDHPVAVQIGFNTNAARYSYDFTVVDADGKRYRGDGAKNEDHFSYGRPVLAPGDGTVVSIMNGTAEDGAGMSIAAVRENGMVMFGNYVVIDHGNGEFSHLGHSAARQRQSRSGRQGPRRAAARAGWHVGFVVVPAPPLRARDERRVGWRRTALAVRGLRPGPRCDARPRRWHEPGLG